MDVGFMAGSVSDEWLHGIRFAPDIMARRRGWQGGFVEPRPPRQSHRRGFRPGVKHPRLGRTDSPIRFRSLGSPGREDETRDRTTNRAGSLRQGNGLAGCLPMNRAFARQPPATGVRPSPGAAGSAASSPVGETGAGRVGERCCARGRAHSGSGGSWAQGTRAARGRFP